MYILGVHNSYDSGAALFKDGKCLFAINEERISRIKMDDNFPSQSIAACLRFAGITSQDIDVVSYAWHDGFHESQLLGYVTRAVEIAAEGEDAKRIMLERVQVEVERSIPRRQQFDEEMAKLGLDKKIESFDHHTGHAAAAFFGSPYEKALVITLDAAGNFRSGSVSIGEGTTLKEVSCNYTWDSLGFFYGQITELLGFKPHRHEGKVTGLAAYGDPTKCLEVMREMISFKDGRVLGQIGKYYKPFFYEQTELLKEALKSFSREDIAAAAQKHFEEVTTEYIAYHARQNNISTVVCAGGVFANVKLNERIRALSEVKELYVFPHMGDGGLSVGACYLSLAKRGLRPEPMSNVYLGTGTTVEDIEAAKVKYANQVVFEPYEHEALVSITLDLIEKGTIIGLFQGRMEYGPRALGNRSVIYHARDATVNDWLNKRMHRSEFMPFAPVTTAELAPRCFVGWEKSHLTTRYMTECYDCTPEMKTNSPAVVHVDGTARPQIIERTDNPLYFDLVDGWNKKTGDLCLINTSFNQHEHPIVHTIFDAIDSMLADNVDVVVAEDQYLIRKK